MGAEQGLTDLRPQAQQGQWQGREQRAADTEHYVDAGMPHGEPEVAVVGLQGAAVVGEADKLGGAGEGVVVMEAHPQTYAHADEAEDTGYREGGANVEVGQQPLAPGRGRSHHSPPSSRVSSQRSTCSL